MNKDELMQTKVLYRNQYEIYLKKIKHYENMIDLNEIKKLYKNKKRFNEKDLIYYSMHVYALLHLDGGNSE